MMIMCNSAHMQDNYNTEVNNSIVYKRFAGMLK